jgi:regulator of protease activity HflC (stomatin/prohibitin superfamily)
MDRVFLLAVGVVLVCVTMIGLPMFVVPHYNVWSAGMRGQAMLREAEHSKRITIETAKAKVEAAKLEAEAEFERAKGMSKSIEAVGEMASKFPEYKLQRFIEAYATALEDGKIDQIIYVPTEANIPIVEAGRVAK